MNWRKKLFLEKEAVKNIDKKIYFANIKIYEQKNQPYRKFLFFLFCIL
jgi:hypothetical protein